MLHQSTIKLLLVILVSAQGYSYGPRVSYGSRSASFGSNISMQTVNGKMMISLDGIPINLARATKLSENNQQVVYSPVEVRGAIIKINKRDNHVTIDYNGSHYETVKPEEVASMVKQQSGAIFNTINQSMNDMNRHMQAMSNNMFNSFRFPF